MTLCSAFENSAGLRPDKAAIYWGEQEYSYLQILQTAARVCEILQREFGVKRGDRVGVWLKNCPEFLPAVFGILQTGGVVVPINNFLKPAEVSYILEDAGIDVLITDEELGASFGRFKAERAALKLFEVRKITESIQYSVSSVQNGKLTASHPRFSIEPPASSIQHPGSGCILPAPRPTTPSSDLAVIIYTSGTTGRPKGAMLSHANLLHNVESCRIVLQVVETDRIAVLLPLFHSYMLTVGMFLPLIVAGSIVLVKSLHPVKSALQEILDRKATLLPAIPQFYRSMVNVPLPMPLPFRLCVSGAAPLPVQVLKEFEAKFGIPLIEGYGLSEASPVVAKNPPDGTRKAGSIGLPIPDVEISIQDECGRELGEHEIGELCVRGGNVMQGYWNKPEETAKVMRNDWLLTGDVGYRDKDGYYYITDRKKDMLLVNGINVYPREIEEVLYQFPGIKEAAVIGKPDARKGEQPVAFIASGDGTALDERAIQEFIRERLADYKVPRRIVFLPSLPRNATGKILKTALRQMSE